MKLRSFFGLLFFLLLSLSAAWLGARATFPSIPTWYAALHKPAFNPPNYVFGPVWTLLYVMMSIAAWKVWKKTVIYSSCFLFYFLQLAANALWSIFFFAWHRPDIALLDILLLWIFLALTFFSFKKIDKSAAYLLIPYWIWVSFAAYLNFGIWKLN